MASFRFAVFAGLLLVAAIGSTSAVEFLKSQEQLDELIAESEGDLLAFVARININKVKQYEAFQELERNFNAHDFDDVHFYAVPRSDTEFRDGKNYLIEKPPELWLFHGLNNGTVRPRVRGKAVGRSDPIVYTESERKPWSGANLTAFAVINMIPHYFTFPPFPEERGYANEVQRARIGARAQWPKLMLINTEENSANVNEAMYHEALTSAGIALKQTAQAIVFRMTIPESDIDEMYQSMGIHDPLQAKMHLLKENAVHIVYFDPVSLLFGAQYYMIENVNTAQKVIRLVVQMIAMQPKTLADELQVGNRPPLRAPEDIKQDKAAGHAREYLKEASFAGLMAATKGQKPYPGAMGSSEWNEIYEQREDGTFFIKSEVLKEEMAGGAGGKKKKSRKKASGKKSRAAREEADLETASTDDASQQCKAGDASCGGGAAPERAKKTGKKSKGHEEL